MIKIEIVKINLNNQIIQSSQPTLLGHSTNLTAQAVDGTTSLTVESSASFVDNDWVLIGKFGEESAEATDLTVTPTDDHAITVTAIKHNHSAGTPVSFLKYNRIRFKSSTTETGTFTDVAGATGIVIQPDREVTAFEDVAMTSTTWYEVFGYDTKNTTTSAASQAVQATGFKTGSLREIIDSARGLTRQPTEDFVTDDDIKRMGNTALSSLQSKKGWAAMEGVDYGALYVGRTVYSLPTDYQRIKYLKIYDEESLGTWYAGQWTEATSAYADDTTDAKDTGVDDFPLCTTTTKSGFAVVGAEKFCRVTIQIGIAQVGSPVYVYYYWNGSDWTALTDYIVDTPVYTTVNVSTDLSFIPPDDWRPLPNTTTWKDKDAASLKDNYAILMKATTAPTTAPVADYIGVYYADSFKYCSYADPSEFKAIRATNAASSKTEFPSSITIWGTNYELYPVPQYNRLTELTYYKDLTAYSEMNDVSAIPSHLPVLWNVCMQMELQFGELQRAGEFERRYNEAIEELVREEEKQYDRLMYVREE